MRRKTLKMIQEEELRKFRCYPRWPKKRWVTVHPCIYLNENKLLKDTLKRWKAAGYKTMKQPIVRNKKQIGWQIKVLEER